MPEESFRIHSLSIPHYPIEAAFDLRWTVCIRGFGIDAERTIETAVADELERQAQRYDIHNEYLRAAMLLNGEVVTHFGTINVYDEFGVTRQAEVINMAWSPEWCSECYSKGYKKGLKNGSPSHYVAFCGAGFFNALINAAEIKLLTLTAKQTATLRNELGVVMAGYTVAPLW